MKVEQVRRYAPWYGYARTGANELARLNGWRAGWRRRLAEHPFASPGWVPGERLVMMMIEFWLEDAYVPLRERIPLTFRLIYDPPWARC